MHVEGTGHTFRELHTSAVQSCVSKLPVLINSSLPRDLGEVQAAPFLSIILAFWVLFQMLALIKAGLQFVWKDLVTPVDYNSSFCGYKRTLKSADLGKGMDVR